MDTLGRFYGAGVEDGAGHTVKTATGLIAWFLHMTGAWAVTLPWKTIYCRPEHVDDPKLLAHEKVHLEQIERDGAVLWTLKVFWYLLRYGYKDSPYEIEARNNTSPSGLF